jgi:hypothetical protein
MRVASVRKPGVLPPSTGGKEPRYNPMTSIVKCSTVFDQSLILALRALLLLRSDGEVERAFPLDKSISAIPIPDIKSTSSHLPHHAAFPIKATKHAIRTYLLVCASPSTIPKHTKEPRNSTGIVHK